MQKYKVLTFVLIFEPTTSKSNQDNTQISVNTWRLQLEITYCKKIKAWIDRETVDDYK